MKHKKDRKDSDDRKRNDTDLGAGDFVVTEVEGKKKKRKEKKKEREGTIDGARSISLVLQGADSDASYARIYICRYENWQRKEEIDSHTLRRARRVPNLQGIIIY
jgi:hypothetical protein